MIEDIKRMLMPNSENPDLLGILLMGSISADAYDSKSDIDLLAIYDKKKPDLIVPETSMKWDIDYMTKEEILNIDESDWRANSFLTAKVLIDKMGCLNDTIYSICSLDKLTEQQMKNRVSGSLGAYLNAFYRSMKAKRRNNRLGALLEASDSIRYLIFCLYSFNSLIPPYEDRIEATIDMVKELPMEREDLCLIITQIAETADREKQSVLFKAVEKFFRKAGYDHDFDEWGDMLYNELTK